MHVYLNNELFMHHSSYVILDELSSHLRQRAQWFHGGFYVPFWFYYLYTFNWMENFSSCQHTTFIKIIQMVSTDIVFDSFSDMAFMTSLFNPENTKMFSLNVKTDNYCIESNSDHSYLSLLTKQTHKDKLFQFMSE